MSVVFRRGIALSASMASLKKASKVVCIGRNYAYVHSFYFPPLNFGSMELTIGFAETISPN